MKDHITRINALNGDYLQESLSKLEQLDQRVWEDYF